MRSRAPFEKNPWRPFLGKERKRKRRRKKNTCRPEYYHLHLYTVPRGGRHRPMMLTCTAFVRRLLTGYYAHMWLTAFCWLSLAPLPAVSFEGQRDRSLICLLSVSVHRMVLHTKGGKDCVLCQALPSRTAVVKRFKSTRNSSFSTTYALRTVDSLSFSCSIVFLFFLFLLFVERPFLLFRNSSCGTRYQLTDTPLTDKSKKSEKRTRRLTRMDGQIVGRGWRGRTARLWRMSRPRSSDGKDYMIPMIYMTCVWNSLLITWCFFRRGHSVRPESCIAVERVDCLEPFVLLL